MTDHPPLTHKLFWLLYLVSTFRLKKIKAKDQLAEIVDIAILDLSDTLEWKPKKPTFIIVGSAKCGHHRSGFHLVPAIPIVA